MTGTTGERNRSEATSLVSVIIPVYNGEKYLVEAIDSVLSQTYGEHEIIVVDDGSTDASGELARGLKGVRYHYQENRGISAARNQGIAMARGGTLALLDADDVWLPSKLELQIEAMKKDCSLEMVFAHVEEFVSPDIAASPIAGRLTARSARPGLIPSALLITRDAFYRVGAFEGKWKQSEFVGWYARAKEQSLIETVLPEVLVRRRIHGENHGLKHGDTSSRDIVRILKASLDRRRRSVDGPTGPEREHP